MRGIPHSGSVPSVKLVSGLLYPADAPRLYEWARGELRGLWGEIERESECFDFGFTDYYKDISPRLVRVFFSFKGLRPADGLPGWKMSAVETEARSGDPRRVNIDPGYIDGARLVLASTKDNAHRVYISGGIFAEVTLCRRKRGWESFSYTFPDFAGGLYDEFLEAVRLDWRRETRLLKNMEG